MAFSGAAAVRKMLEFKPGRLYWGAGYAMFRTVDLRDSRRAGKKMVFVDSNVLVDGRVVARDVTRTQAEKMFEQFREEYGVFGVED